MSKQTNARTKQGPPTIETIPRQAAEPNREVVIPLEATHDSDFVRLELVGSSDGAVIDEASHEFRWTPTHHDAGKVRKFQVQAVDSRGVQSAPQTIQLSVGSQLSMGSGGSAPMAITPIPDQSIPVGRSFLCQVYATGEEPLTFSFVNPVPPLSIDGSGMITGTPDSPKVISVEVEVIDSLGASATESFDLTVTNQKPTIAPIADQTIPVGQTFSQQVYASDLENEFLSYSFVNPVPPLSIDGSGMITGTLDSAGVISVEVQVSDPHAYSATESFDLIVTNKPPTIAAIPDQQIPVGQPFSCQVYASDPECQQLSYGFVNPVPPLSIDTQGLISGTPTSAGVLSVEVQVTDPHNAAATESFDLIVTNQPPVITPIPDQTIPAGASFSRQVYASDLEGELLSYSFVNPAPPLSIDSSGLITGMPDTPGVISVEVEVTDPHGLSATESFDLIVN